MDGLEERGVCLCSPGAMLFPHVPAYTHVVDRGCIALVIVVPVCLPLWYGWKLVSENWAAESYPRCVGGGRL